MILIALLLTALLVIVALVIDLSFVRQNRQLGKSTADFAAAAGVRALDDGSGQVQPWAGICAARSFLIANNPEFSGMTETFQNGVGGTVSNPCSPINADLCSDASPSTWGVLIGEADGGRLRMTIRNGYPLPDPAFPEDSGTAYAGDVTDACMQLAVIIDERTEANFGGVAGAASYETMMRSVARTQREGGEIAAALIMLERTRCQVLTSAGTTATIEAKGRDDAPGTIHSDSLASDSSCANNRKIFDVDGSPSLPAIKALAAADGSAPGLISSRSLMGITGSQPQFTADSPQETCVEAAVDDCTVAPITGLPIVGRPLVTRSVVDSRYITHIRGIRDEALMKSSWGALTATSNQFTVFPCGHSSGFSTATGRVFVDCGGGAFDGTGKSFPDGYEVVINGYVTLGGTLDLGNSTRVFIAGRNGGNNRAISLGTGNGLVQNDGTSVTCDQRYGVAPDTRGLLVIGKGSLYGNGGFVRLCQTTVVMLDNRGTPGCGIPSTLGVAPYANSCVGPVDFSGGISIDWSAPNVNDVTDPTDGQLANLEDLALWSESQLNQSVVGNGGLTLAGIFFTPNADPFTLSGGGTVDLLDAQFISRRLRANGGGTLTLSPKKPNSIKLPALGSFELVR